MDARMGGYATKREECADESVGSAIGKHVSSTMSSLWGEMRAFVEKTMLGGECCDMAGVRAEGVWERVMGRKVAPEASGQGWWIVLGS